MKRHGTTFSIGLVGAALLALQACSSSDDSSGAPDPGVTDTAAPPDDAGVDTVAGQPAGQTTGSGDFGAIAGLYDESYERNGLTDVVYTEISPDGSVVQYNYRGDAFDGGENCYTLFEFRVESLGEDSYRFVGSSFTGLPLAAVRTESGLAFGFADTFDENGDGDRTDTATEFWPFLEGLSSTDFNPC